MLDEVWGGWLSMLMPPRVVLAPLPATSGGVVAAPVSVGAVKSMLTLLTVALLVLPALSSAWPATDCPAPSLARVVGSVQPAMPDSASLQAKLTVTAVLFQPKPLAAGSRLPMIVGGTLSIFSVMLWPGAELSS